MRLDDINFDLGDKITIENLLQSYKNIIHDLKMFNHHDEDLEYLNETKKCISHIVCYYHNKGVELLNRAEREELNEIESRKAKLLMKYMGS